MRKKSADRHTLSAAVLDGNRLIDINDVASLLGIDPRTVHRWVDTGKIPAPIRRLSARRLKWRLATILDFIKGLEAEAAAAAV